MKLTIYFLSFAILLACDAHAAVSQNIHSQRSLRQQVDSYAELLQKEVAKAKNNKERYSVLNRVLRQIKEIRENGAPQGAMDEAHMDLLVTVLETLPSERSFKRRDCYKYENDLISQYEPTAEENPTEPAVKPAWEVLRSLCR